jgi:predicted aconitase with swiveling domain
MAVLTLAGRGIVEGTCRAEALVSARSISFLGGVDPADGRIIEKNHDICGRCVRDKVLVFPHGHGSTVGSYVMYSLAKKRLAPAAIINQTADPVVVVGAIIAKIPMIDQIDITKIRTGDTIEVDGCTGIARILKRKEN